MFDQRSFYFCVFTSFQGFSLQNNQTDMPFSRVSAAHSPLPSKSPAAALVVAPQQVAAAPASKLFDISAVPVVKVSGPLLRSCSKAISTMTSDPDMIWFVSPGEIASLRLTNAPARAPRERLACHGLFTLRFFCKLMQILQWTTKHCSCLITRRSSRNLWILVLFKRNC